MQKIKLDSKTIFYLCFYLFILVEIFLIVPLQFKKIANLNKKSSAIKKKIEQFNKDLTSQGILINDKAVIENSILDLEKKIISSSDAFDVSAYISARAKENAVDIKEITPFNIIDYKTLTCGKFLHLPLKIEAKSSYHNLGKFLSVLDQGDYLFEMKELTVRESTPYHSVNMTLNVLIKE